MGELRCRVRIANCRRAALSGLIFLLLTILSGCEGRQSALAPAGKEAAEIAALFYWMAGAGLLIWAVVIGLAFYLMFIAPTEHNERRSKLLIIGGGVVVPTLLLTLLLVLGLPMLPRLVAEAPEDALVIEVEGLQWWWRVKYPDAQALDEFSVPAEGRPIRNASETTLSRGEETAVETANEIYLPVGQPVQFYLTSGDVIHSFWIPSLGGKVDMVPGRRTRLRLTPTRTGTYRGACAEYCGGSHALMNFDVVVVEPEEFEAWLAEQRQPAVVPSDEWASRGEALFQPHGCGACHTIRGTPAAGRVGPDLTHVGSRTSLAAAALPNDREYFARWIYDPGAVKPEALMPHFRHLPPDEIEALAAYLEALK